MRAYIREWLDPSLNEDENYDTIIAKVEELDGMFLEPDDLTKEEVEQLGGGTQLCALIEMYDNITPTRQQEVWEEISELVLQYWHLLLTEEEEWIRRKISKMLRSANKISKTLKT